MPARKTITEVVESFRRAHGERYSYECLDYRNGHTKVTVTCGIHGPFQVTPRHHANGVGCKRCVFGAKRISKRQFIDEARRNFGARFDYSLFDELPKPGVKVPIRCIQHGLVFKQDPRSHRRGHHGCSRCQSQTLCAVGSGLSKDADLASLTTNFIARARSRHGDAYDYSRFQYTTMQVEGVFVCPEHGEFRQTPGNHLSGNGCPRCSFESKHADSLKTRCKQDNLNYHRTLKRRQAGLPDDKVFADGYVRSSRVTRPVTVNGVEYPNLRMAARATGAPATPKTIARWLGEGQSPEQAFARVPNPGYRNGIIYRVTHKDSGRQYVGLTIQTSKRRWSYHCEQAAAGGVASAESLHATIRRCGADAFTIKVIDRGTTKRDLEAKERYWIKELDRHRTMVPRGFNISRGGVSGGSTPKPVSVDGHSFPSCGDAAKYVSCTRGISVSAAAKRLAVGRIDVRTPAKPGASQVKTQGYRTWSRMVHGATNPKSKDYIAGLEIHPAWLDFDVFIVDVGRPPGPGMAFTRLDKTLGFFPSNCRWLTKGESSRLNAAHMKAAGTLTGNTHRHRVRRRRTAQRGGAN